jgi:hypothetical protein
MVRPSSWFLGVVGFWASTGTKVAGVAMIRAARIMLALGAEKVS